ncbi:MAG: DUF692 domain-containing protein [Pseudomonadota bacterium]
MPATAGVGLKTKHFRAALEHPDPDLWVEVHPENYMSDGGPRLAWLDAIRARRPLSLHGVGASLGGGEPLDADHLKRLKALVERYQPQSVSEHASWSAQGGVFFADLLPIPRTKSALDALCANVQQMQDAVGRPILIENPTIYIPLKAEMDEPDFLEEVCKRTGCGLILDVNNVFISAQNAGFDAYDYLGRVDPALVGEIHVAGHIEDPNIGGLLIDNHGAPVCDPVWEMLAFTLRRMGPKPVLLERDNDVPSFEDLMDERNRAAASIAQAATGARAAA